jgi:hypothetical protein
LGSADKPFRDLHVINPVPFASTSAYAVAANTANFADNSDYANYASEAILAYNAWQAGTSTYANVAGDVTGTTTAKVARWAEYPAVTNVSPALSNAYDLGSLEMPFRDLYLGSNSIYMGGMKVFSVSNGQIIVDTVMILPSTTNGQGAVAYDDMTNWVVNYVTSGIPSSGTSVYAIAAGTSYYANVAGRADWASWSANATNAEYAYQAGTSYYASVASRADWASVAANATNAEYALQSGTSTYSTAAGTANWASWSANSTNAEYALQAGTSVYAIAAGTSVYANAAGEASNTFHTYSAKATVANADEYLLWDSATSNYMKQTRSTLMIGVVAQSANSYIISGSATWNTGMVFNVSACSYIIMGSVYASTASVVALSAADPSYDRIDIIAVNTNGQAVVITGTPAASPAKPNIDESSQLEVTFVTVAAGQTTPSVSAINIYLENTEWVTATNTSRIQPASTEQVYQGSKSVKFAAAQPNDYITFSPAAAVDFTGAGNLEIHIKSLATSTWYPLGGGNGCYLMLTFYNGSTNWNGNTAYIYNGQFGFSGTSTNWQTLSIPLSTFNMPSIGNVGQLKILEGRTSGSGALDIYLDQIRSIRGQSGGPATDIDAIHRTVANEINGLTAKTNPVSSDIFVIEDSASSYSKRKVSLGNLPFLTNNNSLALKTIYVATNGVDSNDGLLYSTPKLTVKSAYDSASYGDSILILPGTYLLTNELIVTRGVIVQSFSGTPTNTILDRGLSYTGRLVTLRHPAAVLRGVTTRNGYLPGGVDVAGNILVDSMALVDNCIIEKGYAGQYGGGIQIDDEGGRVERCIIRNNVSGAWGGGAFIAGPGYLDSCSIYSNTAGAGGGVFVHQVAVADKSEVRNCTIVSNVALGSFGVYYGGGLTMNQYGIARNNIIWTNSPNDTLRLNMSAAQLALQRYNDEGIIQTSSGGQTPTGPGNISTNPLFVNLASRNFALSTGSPCIRAGLNPISKLDVIEGVRYEAPLCSMGAYEYHTLDVVAYASTAGTSSYASVAGNAITNGQPNVNLGTNLMVNGVPVLTNAPAAGITNGQNNVRLGTNTLIGSNTVLIGRTIASNGVYVVDMGNPSLGGMQITGGGGTIQMANGSDAIKISGQPFTMMAPAAGNMFTWNSTAGVQWGNLDYLGDWRFWLASDIFMMSNNVIGFGPRTNATIRYDYATSNLLITPWSLSNPDGRVDIDGQLSVQGRRILNVDDGVGSFDAMNVRQMTNRSTRITAYEVWGPTQRIDTLIANNSTVLQTLTLATESGTNQMLLNGTFTSSVYWVNNGLWTISGGEASASVGGSSSAWIYDTSAPRQQVGHTYRIVYEIKSITITNSTPWDPSYDASFRVGIDNQYAFAIHTNGAVAGWYTNYYTVTMPFTSFGLIFTLAANDQDVQSVVIDNVSMVDLTTVAITGNLIPSASNTYDIGSADAPWRDLYLGTSSVYMGSVKVLSYNPSTTSLVVNVPVSGTTVFEPSYTEGYSHTGTLTLTSRNVYYTWTNWTPGESSSGIGWISNGVYIVNDAAAGLYQIVGNFSMTQNQAAEPLEGEIFYGTNGWATVGFEKLAGHTYMATAGEYYSIAVGGFMRLKKNDYLELKFKNSDGAGRIINVNNSTMNIRMLKIAQ